MARKSLAQIAEEISAAIESGYKKEVTASVLEKFRVERSKENPRLVLIKGQTSSGKIVFRAEVYGVGIADSTLEKVIRQVDLGLDIENQVERTLADALLLRVPKRAPSKKEVVQRPFSWTQRNKKQSTSVLNFIRTINRNLPSRLKKNMTLPALVWRTGRFANSVRAVKLNMEQKMPTIEYTYQMSPYQVFESDLGRLPWATPPRNPVKLIDKTIREIAAELSPIKLKTKRLMR